MSKGTAVLVEGLINPLGSDEELEPLWNRLVASYESNQIFQFKNISGQQHIIPPWALNKVTALFEAELQTQGNAGSLLLPQRGRN
jgi:hypothetical protein